MSMEEWNSESIKTYAKIIKKYNKQVKVIEELKDKWLNDFIDGKSVMQFDKFVYNRGK